MAPTMARGKAAITFFREPQLLLVTLDAAAVQSEPLAEDQKPSVSAVR